MEQEQVELGVIGRVLTDQERTELLRDELEYAQWLYARNRAEIDVLERRRDELVQALKLSHDVSMI
jgi:hypothetical protein